MNMTRQTKEIKATDVLSVKCDTVKYRLTHSENRCAAGGASNKAH